MRSFSDAEFVALWTCLAERRDPRNLECWSKVKGTFGLANGAESVDEIYGQASIQTVSDRITSELAWRIDRQPRFARQFPFPSKIFIGFLTLLRGALKIWRGDQVNVEQR